MDYYVAVRPVGDYDGLLTRYTDITGRPPMMPDYGMGYWQSKNRYASQTELLSVAQGFYEVSLPTLIGHLELFTRSNTDQLAEGHTCVNAHY